MNKALIVILMTIILDSAGVGLIFPIMPALMRDLTGSETETIALVYGAFLAIFAFSQFLFAPLLGALSDRYGRRPLLLIALFAGVIDYLIMALSPWLWLVFAARAVAGILAAAITVSLAYIADISPEEDRPRRFGLAHACLGIGFVLGPVVGGFLGEVWVRAPFIAAAGFAALNFVLAVFFLRETHHGSREGKPLDLTSLNPLAPFKMILSLRVLYPVLFVFFIMKLVNQSYPAVLVIFHEDRFGWTMSMLGFALMGYGISQIVFMSILPGPMTKRFGERTTVLIGLAGEFTGLVILANLTVGWVSYTLAPVFALGGVGIPALQTIASVRAGPERQGQVQGVLSSITSLSAIIGPFGFGALYAAVGGNGSGVVWATDALLYVLLVPILFMAPGRMARAVSKANQA